MAKIEVAKSATVVADNHQASKISVSDWNEPQKR